MPNSAIAEFCNADSAVSIVDPSAVIQHGSSIERARIVICLISAGEWIMQKKDNEKAVDERKETEIEGHLTSVS